ncbi:DUF3870 domain-containing protein [Bacillus sp. B15-48]|uniref:DUF3870 domain-containing protein n=1 Tax=Bacillus sp. B15-48 TaxID=1548601 RepID=UPI00193F64DB|nr:DUF3870 domain-containing protein [Bacillus sp. B15-48]MBM4763727.1 DUF3870 domain-containing protein [Bacillus sp. B15-48]
MDLEVKDNHVLVTGFAQLPKGNPVYEVQKNIGCVLVVDVETDVIIEATYTFLQELTNSFLSGLLRGRSLKDTEGIIKVIETRFISGPQKAVIQGLIAAKKNYYDAKQKV